MTFVTNVYLLKILLLEPLGTKMVVLNTTPWTAKDNKDPEGWTEGDNKEAETASSDAPVLFGFQDLASDYYQVQTCLNVKISL